MSIRKANFLIFMRTTVLLSRFLDGHHLYFDKKKISMQLAQDLERRSTYMCSTIRLNRKGWLTDMGGAVAKKIR